MNILLYMPTKNGQAECFLGEEAYRERHKPSRDTEKLIAVDARHANEYMDNTIK